MNKDELIKLICEPAGGVEYQMNDDELDDELPKTLEDESDDIEEESETEEIEDNSVVKKDSSDEDEVTE